MGPVLIGAPGPAASLAPAHSVATSFQSEPGFPRFWSWSKVGTTSVPSWSSSIEAMRSPRFRATIAGFVGLS